MPFSFITLGLCLCPPVLPRPAVYSSNARPIRNDTAAARPPFTVMSAPEAATLLCATRPLTAPRRKVAAAVKSAHVPNRTPTPGAQRRRMTRDGAEQAKGHEGDGALGPGGLVGCQQPELHLHHVLDEEHLVLGEYLQDTRPLRKRPSERKTLSFPAPCLTGSCPSPTFRAPIPGG